MNSYQLRWMSQPVGLIVGDGLRPDILGTLSKNDIARQPIVCGRRTYNLGDLFQVLPLEPTPTETTLRIEGSPNFVRLGGRMKSGILEIVGHGGAMVAAGMTGGRIHVKGSVGRRAGAGMRGGQLYVSENADLLLGGPLPGGITGMTGGAIVVLGNAGDYPALKQRRGLIAVAGNVGQHPAHGMLGGTLVLAQEDPPPVGLGMEGGTIVLLSDTRNQWSSFRSNAVTSPVFLRLLWRRLKELSFPWPDDLDSSPFLSLFGDSRHNARGEIFIRRNS